MVKALAVTSLVLTGCTGGKKNAQVETNGPVGVETMKVSQTSVSVTGVFSGTVEEKKRTQLSFATAGTVRTMNVRLGDRVEKGQLIGTLDDTSAQSTYAGARASLVQAEDAYRRMKELHDKGSLPEIRWVEVQSKLDQARSMEALARKALEDCRLLAPFGGVIAGKNGEAGQNVVPGMAVAQLVSSTGQQVKIAVPEAEIGSVAVGQKALVTVPALDGKTYRATVAERGVTADAFSRSYEVKLRVDEADNALLPGMVTNVSLLSSDRRQAYVIPARIVQLDEQNRSFVWVANGGKAEKRIITCGEFAGDGVVVAAGLSEGDRVIVRGQQKVCNGTVLNEERRMENEE